MYATPRTATLADAVFPQSTLLRHAALVVGFSLLNALSAQVEIRLPFTPVPITGQTFAVLLTGLLLGSRLGAAAILLYLVEGAVGLPFFAGGKAGIVYAMGPTGGYLVGFLVSAFVVGWLAERGWDRSAWLTALAMVIGNVVIYILGISWLSRFVPADQVLALGVIPFLLGDALKIILAAVLLPAGWKLFGNRRPL